jgi:heptosyltransferase-2
MTAVAVVRRIDFGAHRAPRRQGMQRILVIRGGAIGDFVLTLPAIKALRHANPDAHIEILGYKHIAVLAENRFYAQAVRSIEDGSLSSFFARKTDLPIELADYFASFDVIVSYLFDPDRIFEMNLRHCGVKNFVRGPGKMDHSQHAARQLAKPIHELGINVVDLAAKLFPSPEDRQFANEFLHRLPGPFVAIHPGSGSERKNWPIEKWVEVSRSGAFQSAVGRRSGDRRSLIIISGEADETQCAQLERESRYALFAENLPLPKLAAVLENSIFIGHDSGISHLAAAAGARCILLFGPTDPAIWAPLNENVRVLRAGHDDLRNLDVDLVREALDHALMRMGIKT